MAFVITDPESIRLANVIAAITGETSQEAVLNACPRGLSKFSGETLRKSAIDPQYPS